MTDYRCDHGYYAMGRDCPTCQKERDEARADHRRSMHAAIEQRERLAQATALLREAESEVSDSEKAFVLTDECEFRLKYIGPSLRSRIKAFLAGQPAPVKTKHTTE